MSSPRKEERFQSATGDFGVTSLSFPQRPHAAKESSEMRKSEPQDRPGACLRPSA
jgi:hypothetical protein